ncbi:MAG: dTDP-4-dehydrorhamnose 3,5-epimerase [Candidatus Daviesbacteria bacterium]|nr:MAG: dTDP-4-dehydrorhamnose 3,5-epimerase [Candidatus Daviesbacteria bacterium]
MADTKTKISETEIPGVLIIESPTFEDERGFFRETFRLSELEDHLGFKFNLAQDNHSRTKKGYLRGIHQAPWNKLIYCMRGEVQDIIVDLRVNSPTFGKYLSVNMGEKNRVRVFVPAGCGHGFLSLSQDSDFHYLTDQLWEPGKETGILWNDPDLNIDWQINSPQVSDKDQQNPTFAQVFKK